MLQLNSRRTDPEEQGRERDRFVILLHLHTIGDAMGGSALPTDRIVRDLGFTHARAQELLESLLLAELVRWSGTGDGIVLTRAGREYVERQAGRRRSVRLLR